MRVGRIGYINCYPVYGAIDRGLITNPSEFVTGTPAELNNLLAAGELGVSVVSAVEYARNAKSYYLLPDLAISCDGPVRSVALFSRQEVSNLGGATVLISSSSKTSLHLVELLFSDYWGIEPKLVEARAERQDLDALAQLPHEAVLVIGDAALMLAGRRVYPYRYDLGEVWKTWTGLPFVFAVWAARRDADRSEVTAVHDALLRSRDWGLSHIDELAVEACDATEIDLGVCTEYLSDLDYALSDRHLEGLTSFFRRLAVRGALPDGALSFLSVA